jgi:hypothetical protein
LERHGLLKCFVKLNYNLRLNTMRTPKLWHFVTACVAAFATSLPVAAQQPATIAPPPPRLEPLEEGEPPAITIRKPDEQGQITEKRAPGGKITEIKVTTGNSTYYLKPNDPPDSVPGDAYYTMRAAQWEVLEFDLGPRPEQLQAEAAAAAANAPPPPGGSASAATAKK